MYRPYHFNQESIAGTVFIALLRGGHTLWLVMYDLIKSAGEHSVVASVLLVEERHSECHSSSLLYCGYIAHTRGDNPFYCLSLEL